MGGRLWANWQRRGACPLFRAASRGCAESYSTRSRVAGSTITRSRWRPTEALTNAVRHAYPDSQGPVTLGVKQLADRLVVVVTDEGIGARSFTARGGANRGMGMGLPLLHELCASARIEPGSSGTTVTMGFARAGR